MDLITPGTGLFIWQLIILIISLVLPIYCLFHLYRNKELTGQKLLWALIIIFVPFFGALCYLILRKKR